MHTHIHTYVSLFSFKLSKETREIILKKTTLIYIYLFLIGRAYIIIIYLLLKFNKLSKKIKINFLFFLSISLSDL